MAHVRTAEDSGHRTATAAASQARIDLAREPDFTLATLRFEPSTRQLFASGEAETLEPRVMQVLALLARRRGEVVSRDELVERCWEGRAVSEDAINRSIAKVRRIAETHGGFELETIPRVGYRLTEQAPPLTIARRFHPRWMAAALLLLVAGAFALWVTVLRPGPAQAEPVSLAVLPFRNLSAGDGYFAEGLAEEILGQLARQPGLRVAGRTSSWLFRDNADPRDVGRQLEVAYLLEGSVRQDGRRVRVDVALVETHDGMRRWSQSFQGNLNDIFAIQREIGSAVAGSLRQEIVLSVPTSRETRGDVYSLYLTARGLLRDRSPARAEAAVSLLRRAVEVDPDFAPAWANLGVGMGILAWDTRDPQETRRRRAQALSDARRGLMLAPDSSEAHAAYGALLFQNSLSASRVHLERAVALDPGNAEAWNWLSYLHDRLGNYSRALHAARQAVGLDPLWWRAISTASVMTWDRGHREESLGYMRRAGNAFSPLFARHSMRARIHAMQGNFSDAVAEARLAGRAGDPFNPPWSEYVIAVHLWRLGYLREARRLRPDLFSENELTLRMRRLPDISSATASWYDRRTSSLSIERYLALRLLVDQGRSRDVSAIYDRLFGSPAALTRHPEGHLAFLADAAIIARALLDVDRRREAVEILGAADRAIRSRLAQRDVPRHYHVFCAQIWAVQGANDAAVAALNRAINAGWRGGGDVFPHDIFLSNLDAEPAFRSLSRDPRFRRLRARLTADMDRERAETDAEVI